MDQNCKRLDVYMRSCTRVQSVHGSPRPMGVGKAELATRCLISLAASMTHAQTHAALGGISLTLIDDHSDADFLETTRAILDMCPFPTRLVTMDLTGNGPSLWRAYAEARYHAPDIIYFVEDDYLHAPTAIHEMIEAFTLGSSSSGRDVAVFPCDYPDLYKKPEVSPVFLSKNRYWRVVSSTTGTFMITKGLLEKYWPLYMDLSRYQLDPNISESNTINLVYREVPCFSPMPSLAFHMHEGMHSPFVDWKTWWERSAPHHLHKFRNPIGLQPEPFSV